jgi:hypothetical protein
MREYLEFYANPPITPDEKLRCVLHANGEPLMVDTWIVDSVKPVSLRHLGDMLAECLPALTRGHVFVALAEGGQRKCRQHNKNRDHRQKSAYHVFYTP